MTCCHGNGILMRTLHLKVLKKICTTVDAENDIWIGYNKLDGFFKELLKYKKEKR